MKFQNVGREVFLVEETPTDYEPTDEDIQDFLQRLIQIFQN